MSDKICSHCGATVLMGLQYCPTCLRAVENEVADSASIATLSSQESVNPEPQMSDLQTSWANLVYPLKSTGYQILGRPEPPAPPAVQTQYSADDPRFARKPNGAATMALSISYTRVVCPRCQNVQRASIELSPSEVVSCRACGHRFPGSFAAEFRKGADLECFQCGVTTFCVSGLTDPKCPNCRFQAQHGSGNTKVKPGVYVTLVALLFIAFLAHAVATNTTPQFFIVLCVGCVGSFVGFVTLAALGY